MIATLLLCLSMMTPATDDVLGLPIVQKPHEHEVAQYGYAPWYTRNEVAFDRFNRPYIRSRGSDIDQTGYIHTLRNGRWVKKDFTGAIRQAYPDFEGYHRAAGWAGSRIVFDADGHFYTLLRIRLADGSHRNVLLLSRDHGDSFETCELPLPEAGFHMQYLAGQDVLARPPLIALFRRHASHPSRWGHYHHFWIVQPHKTDDGLIAGEPVHISDRSLSFSCHSGEPSFAASLEDRTIITWIEITEEEDAYGSPVFVATYFPETNTVGDRHLIAQTPPPNDGHNAGGLIADSAGYVDLVTGAHGMNFYYARTLQPGTADEGWIDAQHTLDDGWIVRAGGQSIYGHWHEEGTLLGRQTYAAFNRDQDDTLHLIFRQWRQGEPEYFDGAYYGALSYQRKPAGGEWSDARVLIVPPVQGYSIYYHKLNIDRLGRLFLSYSYYSQRRGEDGELVPYYDKPGRYHYRAVIMSDDGGKTWKLATTEDFAAGISSDAADDAQLNPAQVSGTVIDSAGRPVAGATVVAALQEVDPDAADATDIVPTSIAHAQTGADGRFAIDHIFAEDIVLIVRTEDRPAHQRLLRLDHDTQQQTVRITLE